MADKIKQTSYPTWTEFKSDVFKDLFGEDPIRRGKFLFRGQRDPEWKLSSTFDRSFPSISGHKRINLERELLTHFKKECEDDTDIRDILNDKVATMALAQHHGLPTRLLDWTESPYVAAFFAFQHAVYAFRGIIQDFNPDGNIGLVTK